MAFSSNCRSIGFFIANFDHEQSNHTTNIISIPLAFGIGIYPASGRHAI